MESTNIIKVLNRYPFEEKVKMCVNESIASIKGRLSSDNRENRPGILPSEMETFLMFALSSKDGEYSTFYNKNGYHKFIDIMKTIRKQTNKRHAIERILIGLAKVQSGVDTDVDIMYYRYSYFFNYNNGFDVKPIFFEKFGVDYDEFILLGYFLNTLYYLRMIIPIDVLNYLNVKFEKCIKSLLIDREDYRTEIRKYANEPKEYFYCVRPSYNYPFIIFKGIIYLPLPHLITQSTTLSLYYRLTEGNNDLRSKMGKEVLEKYLFEILNESTLFDEVCPEQFYERNNLSLDVLCRKNDEFIFFESKSYQPKCRIRNFDSEAIQSDIDVLAEKVIQAYNYAQIQFYRNNKYPFSVYIPVSNAKIWVIITILEEPFILRKKIYIRAKDVYKIKYKEELSEEDFMWMQRHIKIYDLYIVESFALHKMNIIEALIKQDNMIDCYDFALEIPHYNDGNQINGKFAKFHEACYGKVLELGEELRAHGILE